MDGRLILLCLSCAVIGQTQGWGYEEPARVVVPTKVFAPAPVITQAIAPTPISAHRHRYSGSLSLSKAKTVINTDDAIINSGYGYASYPVSGYSSYPVFGGHHGYAGAVDGHNGYADVIDGHRGYADVVDGHHGYADVIDGHHGYASVVDGHRGYVRPTVVSAAPEGYFHVERHTSPLLTPPLTSYGALVRYGHHNDLHRDNDYHHYQADLAEQDHFQRFRAEQDDKLHHFQDYIRHEAQEAANRQQLREYERFHKLDNYVHNLERKAEFGALINQVDSKQREIVFDLVFKVIKFCKCRDSIVHLHRYFSGTDDSANKHGYPHQNDDDGNGDDSQLFGEGGLIPIPRSPEQAKRWFMRGLVNTICDSSKFYVEKVKKLANQQGFSATFEAQFNNMATGQEGQYDQNKNNQNQGQQVPTFPRGNDNNNNNNNNTNKNTNYNTNSNSQANTDTNTNNGNYNNVNTRANTNNGNYNNVNTRANTNNGNNNNY